MRCEDLQHWHGSGHDVLPIKSLFVCILLGTSVHSPMYYLPFSFYISTSLRLDSYLCVRVCNRAYMLRVPRVIDTGNRLESTWYFLASSHPVSTATMTPSPPNGGSL